MTFGKAKKPTIPAVSEAEPTPTITEITPEAMKAGEAERRRIRGRTGRPSTRLTTPGFMVPAQVEKRGLKTTFG